MSYPYRPIRILLIEDNQGDIILIKKAFAEAHIFNDLYICRDGQEGLDFLRQQVPFQQVPRPDLILLDINMPRLNGLELLQILKNDSALGSIPVVILTTSESEKDILKSYQLQVSSYIRKPVDYVEFHSAIQKIQDYWFSVVKFPNTTY